MPTAPVPSTNLPDDASVPLTDDNVDAANLYSHLFRDFAIVERIQNLETDLDSVTTTADAVEANTQNGAVASTYLLYSVNPTAGDTIVIGGDTYEFVATGGDLSNDLYIGVVLDGENPDVSYANLADAINATSATNEHAELFQTDSTTPALANGTENVLAAHRAANNTLQLFAADAPGGTKVQGTAPNLAVTAAGLTEATEFVPTNLNLAGGAAGTLVLTKQAHIVHTFVAGDITAKYVDVTVPFVPSMWTAQVVGYGGSVKPDIDLEIYAISGLTATLRAAFDPTGINARFHEETVVVPVNESDTSIVVWRMPPSSRLVGLEFSRPEAAPGTLTMSADVVNPSSAAVVTALASAVDIATGTSGAIQSLPLDDYGTTLSASPVSNAAGDRAISITVACGAGASPPRSVSVTFKYVRYPLPNDKLLLSIYGE